MGSAATTPDARRIGGYVVGARIAVGGMAEVFLARRPSDGAPCVLKVLLPRCARDEATVAALAHEAELSRLLVHDGIVRAFELVSDGDVRAIALELVDGVPLDALLEGGTPLEPGLAVHVAAALLDALAFVHAARDGAGRPLEIVHRDVSPHNVLVSRAGEVKLLDFGIARSALRDHRTRTGLVKGKLQYLSPEQATGSDVDGRTDVYAVGLVLYEMLAGRPFLVGETDLELLRVAEAPSYAKIAQGGVDPRLERVLERALARFPEERFASANAFRLALSPFVADASEARAALASRVASIGPALAPPLLVEAGAPQTRGGARWPWAVVAVAITAALAGWLVSRTPRAPSASATPPAVADLPADVIDTARASARPRATASDVAGTSDAALVEAPRFARDGGRRETMGRAPVSTTTTTTTTTDAAVAETAPSTIAPAVRARRLRLEAAIDARGLVRADLGPEGARAFTELDAAEVAADDVRAAAALARLEAMVAATRADAAVVRRRMARLDARIADARARGEDTRAVESLSRAALEAFVEGRFDVADGRLDAIDRALRP